MDKLQLKLTIVIPLLSGMAEVHTCYTPCNRRKLMVEDITSPSWSHKYPGDEGRQYGLSYNYICWVNVIFVFKEFEFYIVMCAQIY